MICKVPIAINCSLAQVNAVNHKWQRILDIQSEIHAKTPLYCEIIYPWLEWQNDHGCYIFCARHRMNLSPVIKEWTNHSPSTGGIPKLVRVAGMNLVSPFPYINWVNLFDTAHSILIVRATPCFLIVCLCISIELKKAFQLLQLKAFQALSNFSWDNWYIANKGKMWCQTYTTTVELPIYGICIKL